MNYSRRKLLSVTGAGFISSLAGCSMFDPSSSSVSQPDPSSVIKNITVNENNRIQSSRTIRVSEDLLNREENSLFRGQQVRVQLQSDIPLDERESYIFTVDIRQSSGSGDFSNQIWASRDALDRIGVVDNSIVEIQPFAASPIYENRSSAQQNNEFIEQTIASGGRVLFSSIHGGDIYPNTHLQATRGASEAGFSVWTLSGFGESTENAYNKWYISPVNISIQSFYKIQELRNTGGNRFQPDRDRSQFSTVVLFTGHESNGSENIRIGGLGSDEIKLQIRDNLRELFEEERENYSVHLSFEDDQSASDPSHIANELSVENRNGYVISQTEEIRTDYWRQVANQVQEAIQEVQ